MIECQVVHFVPSARLVSCIHHTNDFRQYCHVGTRYSIADWVCFKTQTLLAILRTRNQPREVSCVSLEVEHFVPVSWMCKKQNAVTHSSTESEIISLDASRAFVVACVPACGAPDCLWLVIVESILVFVVIVFYLFLVFVDPEPFWLLNADPVFWK